MSSNLLTQYILLFVLTLLSSTVGNMRTFLLVKGNKTSKLLIVGLDALVYGFLLKLLANDGSVVSVLIFTVGKVSSLFISDFILDRTSKSVYLVHLYLSSKEADVVETYVAENNISCSRTNSSFQSVNRDVLLIHLSKAQYIDLLEFLKTDLGILEPTMDITEVKTSGKINSRLDL